MALFIEHRGKYAPRRVVSLMHDVCRVPLCFFLPCLSYLASSATLLRSAHRVFFFICGGLRSMIVFPILLLRMNLPM